MCVTPGGGKKEGRQGRREKKQAWGKGTRSCRGPLPSPGSHTSLMARRGLSCFIARVSESRAVCRRSQGAERPLAAVIYFRSEHRTAVPITEALEACWWMGTGYRKGGCSGWEQRAVGGGAQAWGTAWPELIETPGWSGVEWTSFRCVLLFVTPWTIQSMEFSRPEHWSG